MEAQKAETVLPTVSYTYMSGFMKTVLKTELSVSFFKLLIYFIYFFAFAMTAACNSYLALNVENVLPHISLIFF